SNHWQHHHGDDEEPSGETKSGSRPDCRRAQKGQAMAEERTLGIAPARETPTETWGDEPSKEELQRRMEQARDSITNTVTEIKENVAQQVENVKDALDWREHFKRQPLAWSLGAAGVGFFVGYGIASAIKGDDDEDFYSSSTGGYQAAAFAAPAPAMRDRLSDSVALES